MRVLLAIDGDNVERTLADELGKRLDFVKMVQIVRPLTQASELEALACFTVPQDNRAVIRQQERFEVISLAGIAVNRWRRGRDPRTGKTMGYPDSWLINKVRQRQDWFDCLALMTADRDYVSLTQQVQEIGKTTTVFSPQPVSWPLFINLFELDELDIQFPGLLQPV